MGNYHPLAEMEKQLVNAGFTSDQLDLFEDLRGVFNGAYAGLSHRFCYHLVELAENPSKGALVKLIFDGPSTIIGVAAKDYRGLATTITGALAERGIPMIQAHLFSAKRYGLALDFFHISLPDRLQGNELTKDLQSLIQKQMLFPESPGSPRPLERGTFTLRLWDESGRYQLHMVTQNHSIGLIHAITSRIYLHLQGNIFGLTAYTGRDSAYITVCHTLPDHLSLGDAQAILEREFCRPKTPEREPIQG